MAENPAVPTQKPVTLVLVNLAEITVDLLRGALEEQDGIHIIGCVSSASDLQPVLRQNLPDVALVGGGSGKDNETAVLLLEQIAAAFPTVRQIVFAQKMENEDVVAFFRAGARGLICSASTRLALLVKSIRCVAMGQIWANSEQLDQLVRSLSLPRSINIVNQLGDSILSKREEQVLHLLADGLSNRELAKALTLSEHTVKNHLFRIFDKLGVSSRIEAVLYAVSQREQRLAGAHKAPASVATSLKAGEMRDRGSSSKVQTKYA